MKKNFPDVAVLDWGIGGLAFLKFFKNQFPDVPVVYFSDSGNMPYGKQSRTDLKKRLCEIIEFLNERGVKKLVVACNAMSTVLDAIPASQFPKGFSLTGVISHAIRKTSEIKKPSTIAIVGGIRTIRSGAYRRPITGLGHSVKQRVAQPLSALIEKGEVHSPRFIALVRKIVHPLRRSDHLILACTHYTAALPVFQKQLPGISIIDPSEATAVWVAKHWEFSTQKHSDVFLTTGDPQKSKRSALKAFKLKMRRFHKIPLRLEKRNS